MVPYGSVLLILYGSIWALMGPYGPIWCHMVPYGTMWFRLFLYGPVWPSMRNVDNKGNGKKKKIIVEIVATTVMTSLLMTPAMLTLVPKDFLLSLRQKKLFYKSEW